MIKFTKNQQLNKHPYLTETDLELMLGGSSDSRYSKIKRLTAQGQLIRIRRGLYCVAEAAKDHTKIHSFELAHLIYAPSYISFESALAYHQLIPEAVYTITSACGKRSKEFHTPLGEFSYLHCPLSNLYTEVELVNENNHQFFIAKPWKAICDYIYCYKKQWRGLQPLLDSLRVHREDLPLLSDQIAANLEEYYHRHDLSRFLKNVQQELQS